MNKKDLTVLVILISAVLMLIAQLTKNNMLFALSFPFVCIAWMWLGAMKKDSVRGRAKISLISILIIWLIAFASMVSMNNSQVTGYFLGLPKATAIMVYGVWVVSFLVVTLVYAIRFDKDYITNEDIKEFNQRTGANLNIEVTENKQGKLNM